METTRTNSFAPFSWLILRRQQFFVKNPSAHKNQTGGLVAETEGMLASHEGTSPQS